MAQDKGDLFLAAQVGKPVPGENAFDGNGHVHVFSIRSYRFEEQFWAARHISVQENFSLPV
jgi:hypothetical protein